MKRVIHILLVFIAVSFCLLQTSAFGITDSLEIKHWSAPDHTRIVIYTGKQVEWNIVNSEASKMLIIDIDNLAKVPLTRRIIVNDTIVREIKASKPNRNKIRLKIYLVKPADCDIFTLERYRWTPARVVINITRPDLVEKERKKRIALKKLHEKGYKIIVIDPGHGGEDLGAIGPSGTREKDVVLMVGKEMERILNSKKRFKAVLTRSHDYFIPLEDRINIAREYGADLFISLHADWTKGKDVRGTSLYCLSLRGASDKGAELLAEKENLSDFIGGVSIEQGNDELQTILLDLIQTKTINDSLRFAGLAMKELSTVNTIKYDRPKQAAFIVLKSPDIPSVLVEIAYLSNPGEEKLLNNKEFQRKFAKTLSTVTTRFLSISPPKERTITKKQTSAKKKQSIHIVSKGESLWRIAAKYRVRTSDLKRLNQLKDVDHILPGTRLILP